MTTPLRLLFLSHSPDNPNGGASRIYHMLASALRARGHAVDLYHFEDFGLPRSKTLAKLTARFALPRYVSRFGARQDLGRYDIIMSSSGMAAPLFERLASEPIRPALVNHLHGLAVYDHIANTTENELGHFDTSLAYKLVTGPFQKRWDNAGIRSADLTILQNLRDFGWVEPRLRDGARAVLIPAAVHPELLAASVAASPLSARDPHRILWFASWESRKGSYYIPGAFRLIRDAYPQARLVIGGADLSDAAIREHFGPLDRDHLEVLPRLSSAEQISEFERSGIFLFPSLSEGFGLALVEALCFGLAAVTTNTAFGGDYLTDGVHARIVFPSTGHIARGVTDLMGSDERRLRIASAGRDLAQTFTLDRMADSYEAEFFRLREQGSGTAKRLPADS